MAASQLRLGRHGWSGRATGFGRRTGATTTSTADKRDNCSRQPSETGGRRQPQFCWWPATVWDLRNQHCQHGCTAFDGHAPDVAMERDEHGHQSGDDQRRHRQHRPNATGDPPRKDDDSQRGACGVPFIVQRWPAGDVGQLRMLTAREPTMAIVVSDTRPWADMIILALTVRGMVSVGLNAVELVSDTYR